MKKKLAIALVCILLVVGIVGGTLAWLTDTTPAVTNTFTTSGIDITLEETNVDGGDADANSYQMIPGWTIEKDPKVTVLANSEDCYLFVKVEKSKVFDDYMEFDMADGWTELESAAGPNFKVYYMIFDGTADSPVKGDAYSVLKNDEIQVLETVTEEMMESLNADIYPTLKITAYATQLMKDNDTEFLPKEAWDVLNPPAP